LNSPRGAHRRTRVEQGELVDGTTSGRTSAE
jgi:hypothetical protein